MMGKISDTVCKVVDFKRGDFRWRGDVESQPSE